MAANRICPPSISGNGKCPARRAALGTSIRRQPANQFDNRRIAIWLSRFVRNIQPGDYNGDGVVDDQDYVLWRKTSGNVVELFEKADGNGSGIVDPNDYAVWRPILRHRARLGLGGAGSNSRTGDRFGSYSLQSAVRDV